MQGVGSDQIQLLGTVAADVFTGVIATQASQPIDVSSYDELAFTLESVGVTSGGTILIEESSRGNYGGTWSQIASVSASSFTGGAQTVYHVAQNAYSFVRLRISATITGGGTVLGFLRRRGV